MRGLVALLACALVPSPLLGCGNTDKGPAPPPSATTTSTAPAPEAPTPKGPLSVVLEAKDPITFSGLAEGVVIADAARTRMATATVEAELVETPMPSGLPAEGQILRFSGRLPSSVWVLFETPKEPVKNPFFRLEQAKESFKQYADDWKPHLAVWSKKRILSMSTSSGKLKVKVVDPYQDKPSPDLPSARLDDEACGKSLRIEQIAALATGEVFASGHCRTGDAAKHHVVVRWAPPVEGKAGEASAAPPPKASASVAPAVASAAPEPAAKEAKDAALDGGAEDGGADGGEVEEAPVGVPGQVYVLPDVPASMKHVALVAQGASDVWLLGAEENGNAHLLRLEGGAFKAQTLPKLGAPARSLAGAGDGTLWLVTADAIWKRYPPGEWEEVAPPAHTSVPELDSRWDMRDVWASGSDVWIAAKHSTNKGERHVVLRARPAKAVVRW
ncbi:hypothetical protein [Polyangium jinanense]|uniref:Lipoprotein n=1 Tax=Polyangium jinanense TaxID=2829994 RepID=A0A9X3X9R5_9BACT|nr:hypothetical protein [Polyangium jinanense]MDC3957194.1 hypothetical protein [Polyangium jinanense]MDC3986649.1 hypothetical protein [Polyangium jinanense]